MKTKFEATFEDLRNYECPEWFRNAKFGIWSHWGPQSVPMDGDWYARNMYLEHTPQYQHHVRTFGHPSAFGYIDICRQWKAERFDPEELLDLYYKAGARYFMAQMTHHDNFFNYDSRVNPFNCVNIGPGKDICRMWKDACKKRGIPFGISEHLAASYNWWYGNKGSDSYGPYKGIPYDGCRKEYEGFYHANSEVGEALRETGDYGEFTAEWMTDNRQFQEYWKQAMIEMIDLLEPDLLYSDSSLPFQQAADKENLAHYQIGLDVVAHLYNTSIARHGSNQAVYTQKDRDPQIYKVGILDVERSQLPEIPEDPWQTDTCIGNWFYDQHVRYKRPDQVIEMLVDIISKNGCMMLNIPQLPDGTIDEEARFLLGELAKWFAICSEAVYDTRPYRVYGEGESRVVIDGFTEHKTEWNPADYRFVTKDHTLYAYMLCAPESRVAVIKSLTEKERVRNVRLLGHGDVAFVQSFGAVTVRLPQELPTGYVNCLALELASD